MLFNDLSLIEPLLRALESEGYERPTPIQQQAIPPVLKGRDLLGCAQTGTGKTAAFALPILQLLHQHPVEKHEGRRPIRTLILTPTRELALQIGESFGAYGRNLSLRHTVIFGGVGQTPQTDALRRGADILVATPGRLLDLMNQGYIDLRKLEIFVLDEADRMLDMGFIHDVRKVIDKLPSKRQTLFFSATMPPEIAGLADSILNDPAKVAVTPPATTSELVAQKVYFVEKKDKKNLLVHLLKDPAIKSALIFTRTKHGANRVAGDLSKAGIRAEAIHGNKSQSARVTALSNFKTGRNRALVATDIAARGIDIDELSHVINFELPNIPETYVHRIGRTGRAGASGIAYSFCDAEELPYLKDIQKLIGQLVPVESDNPYAADLSAPALPQPKAESRGDRGQRNNRSRGKGRPDKGRSQESSKPQREDIIPLPEKRGHQAPRQQERPQQERPQQERRQPERPQQERRPEAARPERREERRPEMPRPERREERRPEMSRPERRDDKRQESSRPEQQQRDRRDERRPNNNKQRGGLIPPRREEKPRAQQPAASQMSKEEVANMMRRRFASILEVSGIEKQDVKRKPKPREEERFDRKNKK